MTTGPHTDRLERFGDVLRDFRRLRESSEAPGLSRMEWVVCEFARLGLAHGTSFNTLTVLRVGADEVVHSGVLAWLLDATAGHGRARVLRNDCTVTVWTNMPIRGAERVEEVNEGDGTEEDGPQPP